MKKRWHQYLWIFSVLYLALGFFNIIYAWLGLICFFVPILMAVIGGNKNYCGKYCGRGQLLSILGNKLHLSRKTDIPRFLKQKWFRYGFLIFFFIMFFNMIYMTYLVFYGTKNLRQVVTLFWTFNVPWHWTFHDPSVSWVSQFAFGFYSVMLTSTLLGFLTMFLYKPRSWCVYCPMGTMTQLICKAKHKTAGNGTQSQNS